MKKNVKNKLKTQLAKHINTLASFSAAGEGVTRFSYTGEDARAREYLLAEFAALGLDVTVDGAGNMRAVLAGANSSLAPVATGSHIDTVPCGGRFDGVVGVAAGLEALRMIKEEGGNKRPVELIVFAEEEGSGFGPSCLGSKLATGQMQVNELEALRTPEGRPALQVMKDFGLDVTQLPQQQIAKESLHGWIELHVEQATNLEASGYSTGIVTAIAGVRLLEIKLKGVSNHAGSTPMGMRADALCAAAEIALAVERVESDHLKNNAVATVGYIDVKPNSFNVIPGDVTMTVDLRHVEDAVMDKGIAIVEQAARDIAEKRGLAVETALMGKGPGTKMSRVVIAAIKAAARELGHDAMEMSSGAVHDTALVSKVAPAGMIFIPSVGGISHSPDEDTHIDDIVAGTRLLHRSLRILAQ